jgi:hypothetical protein
MTIVKESGRLGRLRWYEEIRKGEGAQNDLKV